MKDEDRCENPPRVKQILAAIVFFYILGFLMFAFNPWMLFKELMGLFT